MKQSGQKKHKYNQFDTFKASFHIMNSGENKVKSVLILSWSMTDSSLTSAWLCLPGGKTDTDTINMRSWIVLELVLNLAMSNSMIARGYLAWRFRWRYRHTNEQHIADSVLLAWHNTCNIAAGQQNNNNTWTHTSALFFSPSKLGISILHSWKL